jgi:DNA polymerase III alpha subunit (gram-positive type)
MLTIIKDLFSSPSNKLIPGTEAGTAQQNNNDLKLFSLTKYKNCTYKYVLESNDEKYMKYLFSNFKILMLDITDFLEYVRSKNKYVVEITKLLNIKLLLDTETTGFANYDHVLQLSYVMFNDVEILKSFNQLIKINPKIKINNSDIHGITNDRSFKEGIPIIDALDRLLYDLKYCKSIIGHNIGFDIRMLKNEFVRNKIDCSLFESKLLEDTMTLHGGRIKLGKLYEDLFHEPMVNAHDAYYDVMATYKIYKKLIKDKS